jgi:hypothetical protein
METFLKGLGATILVLVIAALFSFLLGWFVMLLWNALLPAIFGITTITYWQGVGICLLSNLLFKGTSTSSNKKDK